MSSELILTCAALGSQFRFGAAGGTFGRSKKCDWVLPDPNRILSSIHARIVFQVGGFQLIDESTNGTFLAGQEQPIGRSRSVPLKSGMIFTAGPYEIQADIVQGAQEASAALAGMSAPAPPAAAPAPDFTPDSSFLAPGQTYGAPPKNKQSLDPLDYLSGGGDGQQPSVQEPVPASMQIPASAQLTTPQPPVPQRAAAPMPQAPTPQAMEPPAAAPQTPIAEVPGSLTHPAAVGQAPQPAQLATPAAPSPGAIASASPPHAPEGGIPDDFWSSLPGAGLTAVPTAPSSAVIPEDFSTGSHSAAAPATPPVSPIPSTPVQQGTAGSPISNTPPMPLSGAPVVPGAGMMPPVPGPGTAGGLSHLEALKARREQRVAALDAKAMGVDKDEARLAGATASPAGEPTPAQIPAAPQIPANVEETGMAGSTGGVAAAPVQPDGEQEIQALLKGLGFTHAEVPDELRLQVIEDVGAMTRELAAGLIAMMAARKVVKSEFRMDETRIEPKENNPFKYFKVGELALDEMLLTRSDGFLPPAQATRHAFQDLQSHTLVTMSAMQRAMRLLFERLSPEALAQSDDGDGALRLRNLGGRRDKFDNARSTYEDMRKDFESVMRQTIMEAFTQVQEEQARRMSDDYWNKRKK